MARTKKGSKGGGYDFWSRRPFSGRGHGREMKILCHRAERRIADEEIRKEIRCLE